MREYLAEQVGGYAIVRLYDDGFEKLSPKERIFAYYLSQAALAGRDIFYDQNHRNAIEIRDMLEEIYLHREGIEPELFGKISRYLKLFWLNNGNYSDRTKEKFIPDCTFDELTESAEIARQNGADFWLSPGTTLQEKLLRLKPVIFDASFEPIITNKSPEKPDDIITGSANNLYSGVSYREVMEFEKLGMEKHPLNSRLIKAGDQIIEQVYRAGGEGYAPGLYAGEIENIIKNLEEALQYAEGRQREALKKLITFFRTGENQDWLDYNVAWVGYDPIVDTINGFIETYKDARGIKGSYEGIVHIVNKEKTGILKKISENAGYFERKMPWDDRYQKKDFQAPVANAVDVIIGVGDGGPLCSVGINLPNEQEIRERYGNKSVSLQNVMESYNTATAARAIDEFALPEERKAAKKYDASASWLLVSMHEILGHASGKVGEELGKDPSFFLKEQYNALEEARSDLVALYHIFDEKIREIGAIPDREAAEAAYRSYARGGLVMLRRHKGLKTVEDDHMRATNMIVTYLREKAHAIEKVVVENKTYFRVTDMKKMRNGIAELCAEVMRIKAEGDYEAARTLFETYGILFDPGLRDEVVRRATEAQIPDYAGFIMPDLIPLKDENGKITDIRIEYSSDFATQMLRFSGKIQPF